MGKITVSRRSDGDKEGRAQLYVVVYINRDTIRLSTGIKVLESEWDAAHERVKGKLSNDRNLIIDQMKSKVNNIFVKARLRDERLTKESFRRYWDCPAEFDSFHDYIDYYYIKVQRVKELNTLKTYRTVMRKLRDFSPGLTFKEINYDFGMRFLAHLIRPPLRTWQYLRHSWKLLNVTGTSSARHSTRYESGKSRQMWSILIQTSIAV